MCFFHIFYLQCIISNMTDQEIIEAIRKATNGEFVGKGCISTIMGWLKKI